MHPAAVSDPVTAVLASLPSHSAVLDGDGTIVAVSRAWQTFCAANGGRQDDCGVGANYLAACTSASGEERDEALEVAAGIRHVLAGRTQHFTMDYQCSSPQEQRWFQVTVCPLVGASGVPRGGALVCHVDITSRHLDGVALVHQATHDALTGLPDRPLLLRELRRTVVRGQVDGAPVAVLHLDLDGFLAIDDSLGHGAGDVLLRATADRLRAVVRPGDHLSRVGRDEFVAILPHTGVAGARRLARRVAAAVRQPVELDGLSIAVTVSMGIAADDSSSASAEDLLADAESAMRLAKQRGRARTEVVVGQVRAGTEQRAAVQSQVQRALDAGDLQLFRQPVVSLLDGSTVAAEAVLRWFTSDGRLHGADGLLDLTAHAQLARTVTRSVLASATRAVAGTRSTISVDVGLPDLRAPDLVDDVARALERSGCRPAALTIEVSEATVADDPHRAHRAMAALRSLGVRVALDDFGSGATSLALLATLPLDEVKLDSGLTRSCGRPGTRAVVRAVVGMAGDLGLDLVATGVQTRDEQETFLELGLALGQGWRLGPPEPWTSVVREGGPAPQPPSRNAG